MSGKMYEVRKATHRGITSVGFSRYEDMHFQPGDGQMLVQGTPPQVLVGITSLDHLGQGLVAAVMQSQPITADVRIESFYSRDFGEAVDRFIAEALKISLFEGPDDAAHLERQLRNEIAAANVEAELDARRAAANKN